jgi:hypothetical protein
VSCDEFLSFFFEFRTIDNKHTSCDGKFWNTCKINTVLNETRIILTMTFLVMGIGISKIIEGALIQKHKELAHCPQLGV